MGKQLDICILIPCYNEAMTIEKVVLDAKSILPEASILVGDNASTDSTAFLAKRSGAEVICEIRQGKGSMFRTLVSSSDSDIYVMVDGDDTYELSQLPQMIEHFQQQRLSVLLGKRVLGKSLENAYPFGHVFGNKLLSWYFSKLFKVHISDTLTGFRIMSGAFVKSFHNSGPGFELEAEMNIHISNLGLQVEEFPVEYRARPMGSVSKLNTIRDGLNILRILLKSFRTKFPIRAFTYLSIPWLLISFLLTTRAYFDFLSTGQVSRFPSLIAGVGAFIVAVNLITAGIIVNHISESRMASLRQRFVDLSNRA